MTITYRTAGAWGAGKGSNLTAAEADQNFYGLSVSDSRREELRKSMDDQFTKVSTTMELLADKIQSLDGNVIRLGTIIAERVPKTEQQSNLKP